MSLSCIEVDGVSKRGDTAIAVLRCWRDVLPDALWHVGLARWLREGCELFPYPVAQKMLRTEEKEVNDKR